MKADDKQNFHPGDSLGKLNLLWIDLLRVYSAKEKLPLAHLDRPCYFINDGSESLREELCIYFEQWHGKLTSENIAAFRAVQREITDLNRKFNAVISRLCMDGFAIVSIEDFTAKDLLFFGEDTAKLSPRLKEVKVRKAALLKQKKYEEVCRYRVEEKAILEAVKEQFAKEHPGLCFIASWYLDKEIVFLPRGSNYEMKSLVRRAAREAYKDN